METPVLSPDQDLSLDENGSHEVRKKLLLLDASLTVQAATASFYSAFQVAPPETIGKKLVELGHGQWNIPALLTLLNKQPEVEFDDLEMEPDFPALGRKTMLLSVRRLLGGDNQSGMILLSIRDISGQRRSDVEADDLPARFRISLASIGYALIVTDPESRITFMNATAETLTGWAHHDALQNQLKDVFNIVSEQSSRAGGDSHRQSDSRGRGGRSGEPHGPHRPGWQGMADRWPCRSTLRRRRTSGRGRAGFP